MPKKKCYNKFKEILLCYADEVPSIRKLSLDLAVR